MTLKLFGATLLACAAATPSVASAQISIGISVNIAPPPLPVYVQPPLPGPDFIWTPGYWAWDDDAYAYFWVPGTWVRAPRPGFLWTPPWWGWVGGAYTFHTGYWGPTVGFYGGVPYGFGYTGVGFQGGFWSGGHVSYNSAVTNVTNVTNATNIYHTTVVQNHVTRVSYNGGPGGVQARPTPQELVAARQPHIAPTANQQTHFAAAKSDPRLFANANHGRPPVLATPRALSPLHSAGGPPVSGGRDGRVATGPAMTNDLVSRPPADTRAQPDGDPRMSTAHAPAADQRSAGGDAPRPGRPPRAAASDQGNAMPQGMERDAFAPDRAVPRQAQPPRGGQPHPPPPPHRAPPAPPRQPRPHPQPHPQNHPQEPKHEEHH